MSTYASALMDEVARDLLDEATDDTDRRWPKTELLQFLNAGERQLVFLLPTAYVYTNSYRLVEGTKQSLPDGTASYQDPDGATLPQAVELVGITRNMGSDGETDGTAILRVEKETLDNMLPGWHTATASATVDHYTFDPKDRNKFFVYPPQPATGGGPTQGWIEAVFSAVPPEIEAAAGPSYDVNINLEDIYVEPLKHYMKFAAYAKNAATSEFDAARAVAEWNQFVTLIGRKDLTERTYNPMRQHSGNSNNRIPQ